MRSSRVKTNSVLCPAHTSDRQPIVHLCLQPSCCEKSLLLCVKCINESHKGHRTVSMEQFASKVDDLIFDESVLIGITKMKKTIKETKIKYLKNIESLRDQLDKSINEIQDAAERFFISLTDGLNSLINEEQSRLIQRYEIPIEGELFSKTTEKVLFQRKRYLLKSHSNTQILNKIKQMQGVIQRCRFTPIIVNQRSFRQNLSYLSEVKLKLSRLPVVRPYEWSQTMKHPGIETKQSTCTKIDEANSGRCCVGNWKMKCTVNDYYSWAIKINKGSDLAIGICRPDSPNKLKYSNPSPEQRSKLGHGHYTISARGYILSDSDKQINQKQINFKFAEGDIISFQYHPKIGKLIIRKGGQKFQMDIKSSNGEEYVVCAYIGTQGNSITILDQ